MIKTLSVVAAAALLVQSAYAQGRAGNSIKQVKAGDAVQLSDGLNVKVTKAAKSPFNNIKIKGEAIVIVLELDAGKKGARLSYRLSTDPTWSDFYLTSGEQKLGPRAVIEDFPSWGSDNDKEVDVLDPKDQTTGTSLKFQGKGTVSLLFDVPADQSKSQKKVSIFIKTVEPTVEEHTFAVSL